MGGIATRPNLPQNELACALLNDYASLAGQPYPKNVRVPFQPRLDCRAIKDTTFTSALRSVFAFNKISLCSLGTHKLDALRPLCSW